MNFKFCNWLGVCSAFMLTSVGIVLLSVQFVHAQAGDTSFRVNQMEEQVRQLNGKIEELNFQLLQMQEQMRRMQEDNEFRFQELEEQKQGGLAASDKNLAQNDVIDLSPAKENRLGKPQPSEPELQSKRSDGNGRIKKIFQSAGKTPRMIDGVEIYNGQPVSRIEDLAQQPLGTITFDSSGNVVDTALGKPLDLTARLGEHKDTDSTGNGSVAVDLTNIGSARDLYDLGFEYFQVGDYHNSQRAFKQFSEQYPDDPKIAKAQFWLGESMFLQGNFKESAKVFLDTQTNWPDAKIAPQALLKLGVSLAGLHQRELACATYAKVAKKYPDVSKTLKNRVRAEQKSSHCLNG